MCLFRCQRGGRRFRPIAACGVAPTSVPYARIGCMCASWATVPGGLPLYDRRKLSIARMFHGLGAPWPPAIRPGGPEGAVSEPGSSPTDRSQGLPRRGCSRLFRPGALPLRPDCAELRLFLSATALGIWLPVRSRLPSLCVSEGEASLPLPNLRHAMGLWRFPADLLRPTRANPRFLASALARALVFRAAQSRAGVHGGDAVSDLHCGNQGSSARPAYSTVCLVKATPVPPVTCGRRARCGEKHLGGTAPARCPLRLYYSILLVSLSICPELYVEMFYYIFIRCASWQHSIGSTVRCISITSHEWLVCMLTMARKLDIMFSVF